jgi:hypothetical protein
MTELSEHLGLNYKSHVPSGESLGVVEVCAVGNSGVEALGWG